MGELILICGVLMAASLLAGRLRLPMLVLFLALGIAIGARFHRAIGSDAQPTAHPPDWTTLIGYRSPFRAAVWALTVSATPAPTRRRPLSKRTAARRAPAPDASFLQGAFHMRQTALTAKSSTRAIPFEPRPTSPGGE